MIVGGERTELRIKLLQINEEGQHNLMLQTQIWAGDESKSTIELRGFSEETFGGLVANPSECCLISI